MSGITSCGLRSSSLKGAADAASFDIGKTLIWRAGLRCWHSIANPAAKPVVTPMVAQAQASECAVASTATVMAHYGCAVPMTELRRVSGVSRDGIGGPDIVRLGRHYGMQVKAFRTEPEAMAKHGFPLIAFTGFIHFLVVEGVADGKVWINDPGVGRMCKPLEEFNEGFTGVVFRFRPGPEFVKRDEGPKPLVYLRKVLVRNWLAVGAAALAQLAALGLIMASAFLLSTPASPHPMLWAGLALVALALFCARDEILGSASQRETRRTTPALQRHILAQPYAFHSYRFAESLAGLVNAVEPVTSQILQTLVKSVFAVAGMAAVILLAISLNVVAGLILAAAVTLASIIIGLQIKAVLAAKPKADLARATPPLRNMKALDMHRTAGMESELVSSAIGAAAHEMRYSQVLTAATAAVATTQRAWLLGLPLCVWLGSWMLMPTSPLAASESATGLLAMMLLAALAAHLLAECAAIIPRWTSLLRRISLIADVLSHPLPASPLPCEDKADATLCLRNINFGYAGNKPPLLKDISLTLTLGEQLGITGNSGSGKSTLIALLAGLFEPWSGSAELGGVPLAEIDMPSRARQIAWVGKSGILFADSVRANLSLGDPKISEADMQAAVEDAGLAQVLETRTGGLDAQVAEHGINFSGGQRQRLELARALARNPRIVVLDEALEALEPALEHSIRARLRARGCAVLVVSHRASSLAACDRLLVMQNGCLVDKAETTANAQAGEASGVEPVAAHRQSQLGLDGAEQLDSVTRCCLDYMGLGDSHMPAKQHWPAGELGIQTWAKAAGLGAYCMRFPYRDWWRDDHGPLIAFEQIMESNGAAAESDAVFHSPVFPTPTFSSPVFLRPRPNGGYTCIEASGRHAQLTGERAAKFGGRAVMLMATGVANQTRPPGLLRLLGKLAIPERRNLARASAATLGAIAVFTGLLWFANFLQNTAHVISNVWPAVFGMVGLLAASYAFDRSFSLEWIRAQGGWLTHLTGVFWDRLMHIPPGEQRKHTLAELEEQVSSSNALGEIFSAPALISISHFLVSLGGAIALWVISPPAAFAGVTIALFFAALYLLPAARGRQLQEQLRLSQQRQNRLLLDLHHGIAPLRMANADQRIGDRWTQRFGQTQALTTKLRRRRMLESSMTGFGPVLGLLAVMPMLGPTSASASLAILLLLQGCCYFSACAANGIWLWWAKRPAITMLLSAPLEAHASTEKIAVSGNIRADNVDFSYPDLAIPALQGANLSIAPGEIVALLGASGSGKSTMLRLLAGLETAKAGSVYYDDLPMDNAHVHGIRQHVGAVMQEDQLSPTTMRYNIAGRSAYNLDAVWAAATAAGMQQEIRAMPMDMQTLVDEKMISSGQKQRVFIAANLLRQPRVLLLDEATSVLHEDVQSQLFANLRAMGLTCVFATHRASAVAHADRGYVFAEGRVVQAGTPAELLAPGGALDELKANTPDELNGEVRGVELF